MASHLAEQIAAAVATLVTGLTTTGPRVYREAVYDAAQSELPCLLVYSKGRETVKTRTLAPPRIQDRRLPIVIEGLAQAASGLTATLNTIAKEVETALAADPELGGKASGSELLSIDREYTKGGDTAQPSGSVKLSYEVLYLVRENAPDAIAS